MILYILMLLGTLGVFYANYQYRAAGVSWGRPLAGFLVIFVFVLALTSILSTCNKPAKIRESVVSKEQKYLYSTMQFMGEYIATNFPDHKILLITRSHSEKTRKHSQRMLERLKLGLNGKLSILAQESPAPTNTVENLEENGNIPDLDSLYTALFFDGMIERHSDCNLILSLIGLPRDYKELKIWTKENPKERPKLILAFTDIYELKYSIQAEYVSAAITYNRNYRHRIDDEVPKDYREAFRKRFILIDKNNIDEISDKYPGMFKRE